MGGDLGDRDGAVHDLTIRLSGGYIEDDIGIGLLINDTGTYPCGIVCSSGSVLDGDDLSPHVFERLDVGVDGRHDNLIDGSVWNGEIDTLRPFLAYGES